MSKFLKALERADRDRAMFEQTRWQDAFAIVGFRGRGRAGGGARRDTAEDSGVQIQNSPTAPHDDAGDKEGNMDGTRVPDTRQRLTKWVEDSQNVIGLTQALLHEGQSLVSLVQGLLDRDDQLRAKTEASEQECERLRLESDALRSERDDVIGTFSKLVADMLQPMNEMMHRIRGMQRRSPFEREHRPPPLNELMPLSAEGLADR